MAVVAVLAAVLALTACATHLMRALELDSVDARFSLRGTQAQPQDLVVVEIDDRTFSDLGVQWPFPRSLHARLIDRLREAGARTIAFDVQFTEPTAAAEDNALIRAIGHQGGMVLSTTEVDSRGGTNVLGGEEVLRGAGARAASTVVEPDPGGVVRKMAYSVDGLVSFAVAAAGSGERIESGERGGDDEAWIDFRGPPGTIRSIPYSRVLRGDFPPGLFRGKTVVVGAAAPSLQDLHAVSTSGDELMSGPELQANAIWTAERGFPLGSSPPALDLLLILALAAAPAAAALRLRPVPALAAALVLGLLYALATQLAFDGGTVLPVVYPLAALVLAALGALAVNYVLTAFERQHVHDTFARFVPEAVVADVLERTDDDLRLGGVRRQCTVLFSDLRGFTAFAEGLEPDRVIAVLNRYLGAMSDAIMDHGGTLVAYMGDGIMAVFGAPIEQDDHADRALAAAREMLARRLPDFNAWLRDEGLGEGFTIGIGLNSGAVMSGQVGSERRLEYTAIGDTTNTAARLEGMTKGTPHQLFVAAATRAALRAPVADLEPLGKLEVRGRSIPIEVWTLAAAAVEVEP
jgi:adenylate cyclase